MRNQVRTSFMGSFFFIILLLCNSCEVQEEGKNIKMAHGLDTSHPVHKAIAFMADRLEEKSSGSLTIDIYPNQQLGTEREALELIQIGSVGMTKVSTASLENFVPELEVFGLPYLFRDREHLFAVLEGEIGEEFLNASIDKRLKGLAFYDAGSRSFYSKVPIHSPEDLDGLKIRVMESASAIGMVKSLGGSPTPISWGELYTALQQGIVDAAENNLPSFHLSRHYEICKYYILDEHTAPPDVLVIGTQVWNNLSSQEQKWVKEAAMESAEQEKKLWREAELEALAQLEKEGVTVITPDKALFEGRVAPLYEEYSKDPKIAEIIRAIKAVR